MSIEFGPTPKPTKTHEFTETAELIPTLKISGSAEDVGSGELTESNLPLATSLKTGMESIEFVARNGQSDTFWSENIDRKCPL
jgi:hypothetical protein